jgi:uncharacterized RDD family membrane protein YckC
MAHLDTLQTIETPEGVEFEIPLAGPVPRILAALLDMIIRVGIYTIMAIPLAFLGEFGMGVLFLGIFALEWGYPIYFEMYRDGATPGKKALNLQVLDADGTPISWKGSILRNLLRTADFMPFGYAFGIIAMTVTGRFQRLGDLAGDTVVCYRRDRYLSSAAKLPDVPAQPTAHQLTIEEQRAVVQFAQRSVRWNHTRNAELARILEPLTGTSESHAGVRFLQGLANWITRWS